MRLQEILDGRWTTHGEPVLSPSPDTWDDFASMTPVVFSNRELGFPSAKKFGMLFVGVGLGRSSWGIGYADSDDLTGWEKHLKNPLILQEDERAGYQLDAPCILRTGQKFHLICEEKRVVKSLSSSIRNSLSPRAKTLLRAIRRRLAGQVPTVVNHAKDRYFVSFESDDPLSWSEARKSVIFEKNASLASAFDSAGVFSPQVYSFNGLYHMFYGGTDGERASTGLAVAERLNRSWKRAAASPILSPGARGEWDEANALIVSVVRLEDSYLAFYEGEDRSKVYRIGLAYSADLRRWTKWKKNPVMEPGCPDSFSGQMVCGPRAFMHDGGLHLFFNAHSTDMTGYCGMAAFTSR